jgi:hypothetical protein
MRSTRQVREYQAALFDGWFDRRRKKVVEPTGEQVILVKHRHWLVLVVPALATVAACAVLVLAAEPRAWLVGLGAGWTYLARRRGHWSDARTALVVALWLAPIVLTLGAPDLLVRAVALYATLVWFVVTVLRWWCEAIVVSETSLWILSGVITTHSPRAPLTRLLFQDVRQNVVEEVFRVGTLAFDTAGDSDDPLSSFGPVRDPFEVSAQIHKQRLLAMRRSTALHQPPPPSSDEPRPT